MFQRYLIMETEIYTNNGENKEIIQLCVEALLNIIKM